LAATVDRAGQAFWKFVEEHLLAGKVAPGKNRVITMGSPSQRFNDALNFPLSASEPGVIRSLNLMFVSETQTGGHVPNLVLGEDLKIILARDQSDSLDKDSRRCRSPTGLQKHVLYYEEEFLREPHSQSVPTSTRQTAPLSPYHLGQATLSERVQRRP